MRPLRLIAAVLASPRRRRRLAWLAVALGVVGAIAVLVSLIPSPKPRPPDRLMPGPATTPATPQPVRLTVADRREINTTLDSFVPAAVGRRNPLAGRRLATPALRRSATLAEWARGEIAVAEYPAAGTRFHDWTLSYAAAEEASIELSLRPRPGSGVAPAAFAVDLKRVGGRWLVDSVVELGEFSAPPPTPPPAAERAATSEPPPEAAAPGRRVSPLWLIVPGALVGLAVIVPIAVFAVGSWRARRGRRA